MSILFRKLALGGGGVKGILHIGALQELAKHQPLHFPDGVYGSSIGSILAAYVAFGLPVDKMIPLVHKYLKVETIAPTPNFNHLMNSFSTKGIFTMDMFESTLKNMFLDAGLDISDKKLKDANMPLYIVSSNISKRVPSILCGNIPVVDALKCSCCIPALFKPQQLYGQFYVDGDIFSPCISNVVDIDESTLVISLLKQPGVPVTPKNVEKRSPLDYAGSLYLMVMVQLYKAQTKPGALHLKYPGLYSMSTLEDLDVEAICKHAEAELRTFIAKRRNQERAEGSR
jgi:predicted acylesterase/phospholipase RssA